MTIESMMPRLGPPVLRLTYTVDAPDRACAAIAVGVFSDDLDTVPPSFSAAALRAGRFSGEPGTVVRIIDSEGRLCVATGLGVRRSLDMEMLRRSAAALIKAVEDVESVEVRLLQLLPAHADRDMAVQAIVEGIELANYRFDRYKTRPHPARLARVYIEDAVGREKAIGRGCIVAGAVCLVRDLVNEPGQSLVPADFARLGQEYVRDSPITARVRTGTELSDDGFGALVGVGRGSYFPAHLLELHYAPVGARFNVALVGKGITFDSGGLNLKSIAQMETMKNDMAGAATVLAVTLAAAQLGIPIGIHAIMPLAENVPGPTALRPGDVLATYGGKTVEVLNTDAEGRLVLADALGLAAESNVDAIIDVATLSTSTQVALGSEITAVMGNDAPLRELICALAIESGEDAWPLPLPERYLRLLDSPIADIRNVGKTPYGGSLLAGLFLQQFVDGTPWAHLDIDGTATCEEEDHYAGPGATGAGVRTLVATLEAIAIGRWNRSVRDGLNGTGARQTGRTT